MHAALAERVQIKRKRKKTEKGENLDMDEMTALSKKKTTKKKTDYS